MAKFAPKNIDSHTRQRLQEFALACQFLDAQIIQKPTGYYYFTGTVGSLTLTAKKLGTTRKAARLAILELREMRDSDPYRQAAAAMFNVAPGVVTETQRGLARSVSFSARYGR
jgi:hypothetical protein